MSFTQSWLEDPTAIRGVLVEATVSISGVETTLYLSNIGYMTSNASVSFVPVLSNSISLSESISIDGSISMSFGDIEVTNPNGELDGWLASTYVWVNRAIKVYVGDPRWTCADIAAVRGTFGLVFDGIIADLDSKSRSTLNIKVRDKLERLNTPITETVLGNTYYGTGLTQTNQDSILPLIFGEVHNIEPLLTNPATLAYKVNDGAIEKIIELRDNGAPIYTNNNSGVVLSVGVPVGNLTGAVVDEATGTFTLAQKLFGTLTASVQGIKNGVNLITGATTGVYTNNIASIIALICTQYGKASTRLDASDLDLPNLLDFSTANTQSVGVFINDKTNVLDICQQIVSSIGGQIYFNRAGKLQLIKLGTAITSNTSAIGSNVGGIIITAAVNTNNSTITDADILHHSLEITNKTEVVAAVKLGYCKNYTPQSGLTTGIPDSNKTMLAEEVSIIKDNTSASAVATLYKLNTDPEQQDTLLISKSQALTEATRRLNYFKVPSITYKFTGTSKLLGLVLGQQVTLIHNRFDLYRAGAGRVGQVISLSPNWAKGTIEVEVIING